ncbi:unnamed protein product, partial [Linum tenue]
FGVRTREKRSIKQRLSKPHGQSRKSARPCKVSCTAVQGELHGRVSRGRAEITEPSH